jgi:hypothetical protein
MYSFLNDRDLYGSTLSEQPSPAPQRSAQLQSSGPVLVQTLHSRDRPEARAPDPPPDFFLKSVAVLEQRILSLEERLAVALAKFSTEMAAAAARRPSEAAGMSFWTFALAVVAASGLVLLLTWLCRPRWSPPPQPAMPQLVLQGLQAQSLPTMPGPPTPIIFTAPPTFLPSS